MSQIKAFAETSIGQILPSGIVTPQALARATLRVVITPANLARVEHWIFLPALMKHALRG